MNSLRVALWMWSEYGCECPSSPCAVRTRRNTLRGAKARPHASVHRQEHPFGVGEYAEALGMRETPLRQRLDHGAHR